MKMTILPRDDGVTHIVLTGRLDTTGTEQISEEFNEATGAQARPAIVDLTGIEFMASRGIGLLFANGKKLKRAGHGMVLLNPRELVANVLRTSKVDTLMPIACNLDEAIQVARGAAGQSAEKEPSVTSPRPPAQEQTQPARSVSEGELMVSIRNDLSELESLSAKVADFLETHGVPQRATYAVNLAIDELVVNVIRYAYVDDDTHLIDVQVAIEGQQVILRITDDGRPFDPRKGPSLDLHAEDREVGGLGLILVLDMVDVLHYQRLGDKNWVEVRVRLAADDELGDPSTGV